MPTQIERQINAILEELSERGDCPTCFGHPVQLQCFDQDTEAVTWERYPDNRCPDCGRAVSAHVIRMIGLSVDDLP